MQATGVLLLFCTSAYWLLTETSPTTTMGNKDINSLIKEILNLTFPNIKENVSLQLCRDECYPKNLEIFMNATKAIIIKEEKAVGEATYHNLAEIKKLLPSEYESKVCSCEKKIFPFEKFKEKLEEFLEQIRRYKKTSNCS